MQDALTPIDEAAEDENDDEENAGPIPEIVETAASPMAPPINGIAEKEIKQIESVL